MRAVLDKSRYMGYNKYNIMRENIFMKLFIVRVFVLVIRILYAPMKLRKTKNKIVWLSRQSDAKSQDMEMLSREIARISPETKQVFRLKKLRDQTGITLSYIFSVFGDMWQLADSSLAICDTYSIPVSCLNHKKELKVVQIWHALGAVKQFGLQSVGRAEGRSADVARVLSMHKNYDMVIAPSTAAGEFYCKAFDCSMDKIVVASLPRVDVILDGTNRRVEFLASNPRCRGKEIYVYLPTFRDGDGDAIKSLTAEFEKHGDKALVVSAHPHSRTGVCTYSGDFSTYDLMKLSDGIITDYSASAFEASLLGLPLWFFVPDHDVYAKQQGLNTDIKALMQGAFFTDASKLLSEISKKSYDYEALRRFSEAFVTNRGTDNTKKLANIICSFKETKK